MKSKMPLNGNDTSAMKNLWRWKVMTTAAIARLCYPTLTTKTVYNRLSLLEKDGYLQSLPRITTHGYAWTLAKNGFQYVRDLLPELKDEGYRTEAPVHDLIVSAIHIGDQVNGKIPDIKTFSEQELRRYNKEHFPEWVPKSDRHRADGYWLALGSNGPFAVALEVERSLKTDLKYEILAEFYAAHPQVKRIVWVVPSKARCKGLYAKMSEVLRGQPVKHNFLDFPSFLAEGWNAQFIEGPEKGQSLRSMLRIDQGKLSGDLPTTFLLDIRKTPFSSPKWRPLDKNAFCN